MNDSTICTIIIIFILIIAIILFYIGNKMDKKKLEKQKIKKQTIDYSYEGDRNFLSNQFQIFLNSRYGN